MTDNLWLLSSLRLQRRRTSSRTKRAARCRSDRRSRSVVSELKKKRRASLLIYCERMVEIGDFLGTRRPCGCRAWPARRTPAPLVVLPATDGPQLTEHLNFEWAKSRGDQHVNGDDLRPRPGRTWALPTVTTRGLRDAAERNGEDQELPARREALRAPL